jgi:tetratricopeptide (TPR) repeat protein
MKKKHQLDYYAVLGVSSSASQAEIKEAFRKLSLEYHPDRLGTASTGVKKLAEEKQKDINGAYEVLGNSEKRRTYDAQVAERTKQRAEEKARLDKEAKYTRIRNLYESGDLEGAVKEAESLFRSYPDDTDCQNNYAALLYEWAKHLAGQGKLKEASVQLRQAAKHTLDDKLKARIRADLEFARLRLANCCAVLLNALPLGLRFARLWVLPPNLCQPCGFQTGIPFNRTQGVRGFDRSMLARVAGKNDATAIGLHETQKFAHLLRQAVRELSFQDA